MIKLPHGGKNAQFDVKELVEYIKKSGRDYIIQGSQQCSLANHTKKHSLDYWLRSNYAASPDTKQAVKTVIDELVATGLFEEADDLPCLDSGRPCKGIRLIGEHRSYKPKTVTKAPERYNTNLASEFHVLSVLHRLGADAALTLGNKKAVDIFVVRQNGISVTVDVKGLAGKFDWPADNVRLPGKKDHFLALVCYEGRIGDPEESPSVWVIPSLKIESFVKKYRSRTVVSRSLVKKGGGKYWHAWSLILGDSGT